MDKLYIVIPAYNEQENISKTVREWYDVIKTKSDDSRLVVVNDGSKDLTKMVLEDLTEFLPKLVVLTKPNGGHGSAVLYGYRYALENKADFIFQTDSDGQTNPKEFDGFWSERYECDAMLGNRVNRGDGKSRKFVENTVCFLLRLYFGVKAPDANAPFRLMKGELLEKYIEKIPEDYNLPNIILTVFFIKGKNKVLFKEISFGARKAGINSINLKKIVRIGWKALHDFKQFKVAVNNPRLKEWA